MCESGIGDFRLCHFHNELQRGVGRHKSRDFVETEKVMLLTERSKFFGEEFCEQFDKGRIFRAEVSPEANDGDAFVDSHLGHDFMDARAQEDEEPPRQVEVKALREDHHISLWDGCQISLSQTPSLRGISQVPQEYEIFEKRNDEWRRELVELGSVGAGGMLFRQVVKAHQQQPSQLHHPVVQRYEFANVSTYAHHIDLPKIIIEEPHEFVKGILQGHNLSVLNGSVFQEPKIAEYWSHGMNGDTGVGTRRSLLLVGHCTGVPDMLSYNKRFYGAQSHYHRCMLTGSASSLLHFQRGKKNQHKA
ncbi:GH family 3 beta-glucosidase [Perkinsela sp. CCAP 1560/4]|nr:GH family 3 beta-glucosidase [Perkinsela sp. CCAP 1560/4]|eukprot:KNH08914.1 GH family 3 beta-glucosidase [Perkinsela sp. CCAP 1560/4]